MKNLLTILCILFFACGVAGQNLVPNGNFEEYTQCPTIVSQMSHCSGWRQYTMGTADYFHTCGINSVAVPKNWAGFQLPASGLGYAGIYVYEMGNGSYREYMARSIPGLTPGVEYEVSMSVSLSNHSRYATNDLGIYFYVSAPSNINNASILNVTPQVSFTNYLPITDTQNWVRLSAKFVADSAYKNIVIGSFVPSATQVRQTFSTGSQISYYYIDSVVINVSDTSNHVDTTTHTDTVSIKIDDEITWCAGKTVNIELFFELTTPLSDNNVFTALLSDSSGDFTRAIIIGTLKSKYPGKIMCLIPEGLPPGTSYRVRIVSSSPVYNWLSDKIITIVPGPNLITDKSISICPGADISLNAHATGNSLYKWSGPGLFTSESANPIIKNADANHEGLYTVTATHNGCLVKDTVRVTIGCGIVEIPKAFSPNGDGKNDVLYIRTNSVFKELDFRIYNRWGQLVFHTSDIKTGWDGTFNGQELNPEVFGYTITGRFSDGSPLQKMGNVTLIR